MQQIADWLKKLGMSEYTERFVENRIDPFRSSHRPAPRKAWRCLRDRLKILQAIRELSGTAVTVAQPAADAAPLTQHGAERGQLTVVFCDLVGSGVIRQARPEDLRSVIGSPLLYGAGRAKWWFVAKYMNDGVLGYFGYRRGVRHSAAAVS